MIRLPVVASRFYPESSEDLTKEVKQLLSPKPEKLSKAKAVICPHAGYMFSGQLAGKTLASVTIPKTVILLGPNHTGQGAKVSVSSSNWQIPTGTISTSRSIIDDLLSIDATFTIDESAHINEHSLEVMLPFLYELQPDLQIIPITLSKLPLSQCLQLGNSLAELIDKITEDVLIVVSNDMSHFSKKKVATNLDKMVIDRIMAFDPEGVYDTVMTHSISMCGVIPVTVGLQASIKLGANDISLIGYHDSGDISGDNDSVVGYAGLTIN